MKFANSQQNTSLAETSVYANSIDELIEKMNALSNYRTYPFMAGPELYAEILGIETTAYGKGIIGKQDTVLDGMVLRVNSQSIYTFRVTIATGALSNVAVFTGTTVSTTSANPEDSVD